MSAFLGIGLGPIQTGIFLSGAARRGFNRVVIAEVDATLVKAVRDAGGRIGINIATGDGVRAETFEGVEVYNPTVPEDLETLKAVAAEATELSTALPSVNFFKHVAPWLREGFARAPELRRFVYTAENNNHAAELLQAAVGQEFPGTFYLNTVVGKMSKVFVAGDSGAEGLATLTPGFPKGHLVESFNRILISSCPGIEGREVDGLVVKKDLFPFEEAKLYGHNAIHFLVGTLAMERGMTYMSEARGSDEIMAFARAAFIEECGRSLCRKWSGVDPLFTPEGFSAYVEDLLVRMTNPFLNDAVDRICRDPDRKMGWDDRVVGTMRLVLGQGGRPARIATIAKKTAAKIWGVDEAKIRSGCAALWPQPWGTEHEAVLSMILAG